MAASQSYCCRAPLWFVLLASALGLAAHRASADERAVGTSHPEAVAIHRNAAALQNRGLFDLAAQEWADLIQRFPSDPLAEQASFYRGVCLFQLERYAAAADAFGELIRGHPQSKLLEQAYVNRGLAQYNQGQAGQGAAADKMLDAAIATFDEQLRRFPDGPLATQGSFYRAESFYLRDRLDDAAASYEASLAVAPVDHPLRPQALYGLGVVLQEADKLDRATAAYERFLADYSQHTLAPEIQLRCGEVLQERGQFEDAAAHLAKAAAVPDFADADQALQQQAVCHYQLRDYARAAEIYTTLPGRFPDSPLAAEATLSAGECYLLANQLVQAEVWLRQAAAHDAQTVEATHWLARTIIRAGRAADAIKLVDQVLRDGKSGDGLVALKLDRADALWEVPDRRSEAAQSYAAIARRYAADPLAPQAGYMAAYAALELKDYKSALVRAEAFEKSFADSRLFPDVGRIRAEANLQLGNHAAAADTFAALISRYPEHPDRSLWQVRLAFTNLLQERWDEVVAGLQPALAEQADPLLQAEARWLLGKSYLALAEPARAVEVLDWFATAQTSWRRRDEALLLLARAQHAAGQSDNALVTIERLIARHPESQVIPQAYYFRATVREKQGDYAGGLADIAKYLDTEPAPPSKYDALFVRGLCEAGADRFADATATFQRILHDDPQYAETDRVLYELAWAYQETLRADQATATFARLAREHTDSPLAAECWYRVADHEYTAGDFTEAAAGFKKAYQQATDDGELREKALHKLAWARFEQKEFADAAQIFQQQLDEFPEGPLAVDARLMCGDSLFAQARYQQALDVLMPALAGQPASQSVLATSVLHAGQAASQLGQWPRALELFDRFLRDFPESEGREEAIYEKGWALYNTGRRDLAQTLFEEVADRDTSVLGARARFMAGEIQFANQNYADAVRSFFKVAYGYGDQQAPEPFHHWQSEAMFEAGRCLEESNRLRSANNIYQELVDRFPQSEKAVHARVRLRELNARFAGRRAD